MHPSTLFLPSSISLRFSIFYLSSHIHILLRNASLSLDIRSSDEALFVSFSLAYAAIIMTKKNKHKNPRDHPQRSTEVWSGSVGSHLRPWHNPSHPEEKKIHTSHTVQFSLGQSKMHSFSRSHHKRTRKKHDVAFSCPHLSPPNPVWMMGW